MDKMAMEIKKGIHTIVSEILKCDPGEEDNLYLIGLDSIKIILLIAELERVFQITIEDHELKKEHFVSICALTRFMREKLNRPLPSSALVGEAEETIARVAAPSDYHPDAVRDPRFFQSMGEGLLALKGAAAVLFHYFDDIFRELALGMGAEERRYPAMLPLEGYAKTNYLKTSPQYATFVACAREDDMDLLGRLDESVASGNVLASCAEPRLALSPAACFHSYVELESRRFDAPVLLTFCQEVSRNEGAGNWGKVGRLRNYHVREIVFIGDEAYVRRMRETLAHETVKIVQALGMTSTLSVAEDSFVLPAMQRYKTMQRMERMKYELKLAIDPETYIAGASFNLHGTAFVRPFDIRVRQASETVSGCAGFGLERWVLAFFAQFGTDPDRWPEQVRNDRRFTSKMKGMALR